jgi:hypothetical protein
MRKQGHNVWRRLGQLEQAALREPEVTHAQVRAFLHALTDVELDQLIADLTARLPAAEVASVQPAGPTSDLTAAENRALLASLVAWRAAYQQHTTGAENSIAATTLGYVGR